MLFAIHYIALMSVFPIYHLVFCQAYKKSLLRHSSDTSLSGLSHVHLFLISFTQVSFWILYHFQVIPIKSPLTHWPASSAKCCRTKLTTILQFFLDRQAVTLSHIQHPCHLNPPSWWLCFVSTLYSVPNQWPVWITDLMDSFLTCVKKCGHAEEYYS